MAYENTHNINGHVAVILSAICVFPLPLPSSDRNGYCEKNEEAGRKEQMKVADVSFSPLPSLLLG